MAVITSTDKENSTSLFLNIDYNEKQKLIVLELPGPRPSLSFTASQARSLANLLLLYANEAERKN